MHAKAEVDGASVVSNEEFLLDVDAQIKRAFQMLSKLQRGFELAAVGHDLSRELRMETKSFVAELKYVLDQITFRVWTATAKQDLVEEDAVKKATRIYYPYAAAEQGLLSSLGQMISLKSSSGNGKPLLTEMFCVWLKAMQPYNNPKCASLHLIGKLSRLPHQKLIEQRKVREFVLEAYGSNGGGVTSIFRDKPHAFTLWTYKDATSASTGFGEVDTRNIPPDAELTVFRFDPETMSFNDIPNAKTSVTEKVECHIEDHEFDAMELFTTALQAVCHIFGATFSMGVYLIPIDSAPVRFFPTHPDPS